MILSNCENCKKEIIWDSDLYRYPCPNKYHLFCSFCIKNKNICSKSKCQKIFCLTNEDIKNLKTIYIKNPSNNTKFYVFEEIKKIALDKYGSLENIQKIINDKSQKKNERNNNFKIIKEERKNELLQKLKENKLQYKDYGDCYSYVHYGTPNLDQVIQNEITKLEKKNKRRIRLARELAKIEINFNESLSSCYNYINKVGPHKSLKETIRSIEIEYFLKYNTEFEKIKNDLDSEEAKEKAIQNYYNNKLKNNKILKINFD